MLLQPFFVFCLVVTSDPIFSVLKFSFLVFFQSDEVILLIFPLSPSLFHILLNFSLTSNSGFQSAPSENQDYSE